MQRVIFAVEKPFRIYRCVGRSASNSYYGSSRITMPCYEAVNALPGDEIHVGHSLHLVRKTDAGNLGWRVALDAPKGAFEKSYVLHTQEERLDLLAKHDGTVVRIAEPKFPFDTGSVVIRDLPELHPQLVFVEPSHQLEALRASLPNLEAAVIRLATGGARDAAGAAPSLKWRDFLDMPTVVVEVHFGGTDRTLGGKEFPASAMELHWSFRSSMPERGAELRVPKGMFVPGFPVPTDSSSRLDRHRMPIEAARNLLPMLVEEVVEATKSAPAAPGSRR